MFLDYYNKVLTAKDKVEVWGTGNEIRDFLYPDDLVNFVKNAITKQKTQYEIYNCGSGVPIKVKGFSKKDSFISRVRK